MTAIIVDGRSIAREIEMSLQKRALALRERGIVPRLEILSFGNHAATLSFLKVKRKVAERIGVELGVHNLPDSTLESVARDILTLLVRSGAHGVVVQLPLPSNIEKRSFLELVPEELDVDCINPQSLSALSQGVSAHVSPVARAVEEIFSRHAIELADKRIAIVGEGDLVGKPVAHLLKGKGFSYEVFNSRSDLSTLNTFDVLVTGIGKPGCIREEHVYRGAILIDAGTSEDGGVIAGDVDKGAYERAHLVTPVPGGVGPITVVKLFDNLLTAAERHA
jgi:methylenetetrahydrofolate dehydrogenase (NADP+)/methenyltetrahydrofolate cyclohydrolase